MKQLGMLSVLVGCNSFPDPDVVVDLRPLAITATPPEQVVTVDPSAPQNPTELLQQLGPTTVCALVADPTFDRRLRYRFTLCVYGTGARCDEDFVTPIGSGVAADPDSGPLIETQMCATIMPNGNLLGVLTETLQGDPFAGLGGLDYLVQLTVGGDGEDPAHDELAAKTLRVSPKIPLARQANLNPTVDRIEARLEGHEPVTLPLGRCADQGAPLEIAPNTRLEINPIEAASAREAYVVPTITGSSTMFTESLTYQWLASAGGFSSGSTGGPRDIAGNMPELFTEYRAPNASDLDGPLDVQLWIIQRDERYGLAWYESCVRVVP